MKKARNAVPILVFGRFWVLLFVTSDWHTTEEWKKIVEKEKKSGKKEHFLFVFHFLLFLAIHSNNALRKGKKTVKSVEKRCKVLK